MKMSIILKGVQLPMFSGDVYHLSIPSVVVHQSWRSVLAMAIGEIDKIIGKYDKITVLVQGANFATLFALAVQNVFTKEERKRTINTFMLSK